MSRPRNHDPRTAQFNIRFNAREWARVHRNAAIAGKTVPDFGRAALLRKPRPTRKDAPLAITLPPTTITKWHAAGLQLNTAAHDVNLASAPYLPPDLALIIRQLRSLLRRSFRQLDVANSKTPAYSLHPEVRYHLRKICTNLVQIADRYRALEINPPAPLSNLIFQFRLLLNNDHAS